MDRLETVLDLINESNQTQQEEQWVSVEDRLPKDGFYNVIMDTEDGTENHSCWFYKGNWSYDNCFDVGEPTFSTGFYAQVTHWQPLPTPPNNKE